MEREVHAENVRSPCPVPPGGQPPPRPACLPPQPRALHPPAPALSDMDEITYWIYTKRAPCLMKYDDMLKKKEQAQSTSKPKSIQSISDESKAPLPTKKRKLSLLDDESGSTKEQGNVYFDTSKRQQNNKTVLSSCKSSDIDFNIKKTSIQEKPKRKSLLQKNNRTIFHKKNAIVASTPKLTTNLRRSLRNSRKSLNDTLLNTSFEVLDTSAMNGNCKQGTAAHNEIKLMKAAEKKTMERLGCGDTECDKKNCTKIVSDKTKDKLTNVNGKFEDLSDVSGFTANYIRSTKIKNGKRIRNQKNSRSLLKESRRSLQKDKSKLVMSVNKSVNTGLPNNAPLNNSTDSSQHCLNLVTIENNDKSKVNRSTSFLKFMGSPTAKRKNYKPKLESSEQVYNNIDILFESEQTNGLSRYPKRIKNCSKDLSGMTYDHSLPSRQSPRKKKIVSTVINNNVDRNENPDDKSMSKTRSGRNLGLPLRQSDSFLMLSNSTEQVESAATVNVACPRSNHSSPKKVSLKNYKNKRVSSIGTNLKKSMNKSRESTHGRDSIRDKSGFAACFSDSDDDKPLKPQKFFC